eukprot:TRINITY_DN351_c0_g2_i1.p1 TRINITY_DN351_c0_g2~~TRINITY_DN351_c0_g2_i1.p1  ORF type:complete len:274 (+),score=43.17 TRINITY_DN351_c0_g2_i1:318-1139(+)
MTNHSDFGVFEVNDEINYGHYIPRHKFVCDAIANWEKIDKSPDTLAAFKLVFKKGWFMKPNERTRDKVNIRLRYHQALADILAEKQPVTIEEAAFLAALQLKLQGIQPKALKTGKMSKTLFKIIPPSLIEQHDQEEWIELITEATAEIKESKEDRIQRLFLQTVAKWKYYGSAIFAVESRNTKREKLMLAVNKDGVYLFKPSSKKPKASYKFEAISNYAAGKTSFGIVTGSLMKPERLVFTTTRAKEIEEIYHGYVTRANALKARTRRNPRKI